MATTHTENVSEAVLSHWREQGYVLLKQAIPRDEAAAFLAAADAAIARYEAAHRPDGSYTIIQAIEHTAGLDPLIDHPGTFPTIVGTDGTLSPAHGHPGLRAPRRPARRLPLAHRRRPVPATHPRHRRQPAAELQGAVLPHRHPATEPRQLLPGPGQPPGRVPRLRHPEGEDPPGAVQLIVEAGDVAIFPHNLWHSVAPNLGDSVRRSVTFRYGQMWCRPYDYEKVPAEVLARLSPRRRRLLGDMGADYHATDYYKPHDQLEVMLGVLGAGG